jgi:hypothetical protein
MPAFVASILLGDALSDPAAIIISRRTGAALVTIAFACWLSAGTSHAFILIKAMTGYNVMATTLLLYAGVVEKISGVALWSVVFLHVGMVIPRIYLLSKVEK